MGRMKEEKKMNEDEKNMSPPSLDQSGGLGAEPNHMEW